ncbi:hypothetical protein [Microbacterium sp. BLY]|uniref:hypothetical protein n=1 Tax=Microbacterium sp. BLY TaxID=2823280 RepID=UPI001B31CC96|nr:hypothetical protein [Microbacterium sp. BLY]MBP3977824.1 hypothetical protein [Microbacterium sp. BLY]
MRFLSDTPMPTPSMTVAPESVTPGFAGFAVIVIVLVAVILLIWDMNRRIRRVRYREEVREELDAEEAARAAAEGDGPAPETPDARDAERRGDEEPRDR